MIKIVRVNNKFYWVKLYFSKNKIEECIQEFFDDYEDMKNQEENFIKFYLLYLVAKHFTNFPVRKNLDTKGKIEDCIYLINNEGLDEMVRKLPIGQLSKVWL